MITNSIPASVRRQSNWLKFSISVLCRSLQLQRQLQSGVVLPPPFRDRKRQVGVQQIQIDARPAGLFDGIVCWIHLAHSVAKSGMPQRVFSPLGAHPPRFLAPRPVPLALDHPRLLSPGLLPDPPPRRFPFRLRRGCDRGAPVLQLGAQPRPGLHPVHRLGTLRLTADLRARRLMPQPDGGGGLVDFLPAWTRATHKTLRDVTRLHAKGDQPPANIRLDLQWKSSHSFACLLYT